MVFRKYIPVTCQGCGLVFDVRRAPQGTPCVCPDCDAVNAMPKAPPFPWARLLGLLVGAGLLAAGGVIAWNGMNQASSVWELRGEAAAQFRAKDFAAAAQSYARLAELEPLLADEHFRWAQSLAATGQRSLARKMVEQLVEQAGTDWLPHTSLVYPNAEFWLAQEIYTRPQITVADWRSAEARLQTVLLFSPQHEMARRMLMKMQRATGQQLAALANLEKLAPFSTADRLELALAYSSLGKRFEAAQEAKLVVESLLLELGENPENLELRRTAAKAALLAGDFAAAENQLKLALKYGNEEDLETRMRLAEIYEQQAAAVPHDRPDWDRRSLELLCRSIETVPDRSEPYDALTPLTLRPGEVGEQARELLLTGLARGVRPDRLHGLLAQWCSRTGRSDESILHWRAVIAAEPQSVPALNNLAWELCWHQPPMLDEALDMINRALALSPGVPVLRETRGQILARMGRSREALADLLAAIGGMNENARLHATLAEVYRDLKLPDEAKLHIERAAQLEPDTVFEPVRWAKDVTAEPVGSR